MGIGDNVGEDDSDIETDPDNDTKGVIVICDDGDPVNDDVASVVVDIVAVIRLVPDNESVDPGDSVGEFDAVLIYVYIALLVTETDGLGINETVGDDDADILVVSSLVLLLQVV